MKRLFSILVVAFLMCLGVAYGGEPLNKPIYTFTLSLESGITTALNKTATRTGLSIFTIDGSGTVMDMERYGLNEHKVTLQVDRIEYALSNQDDVTLTGGNVSAATAQVFYIPSNINDEISKNGSGVTAITASFALTSGASLIPHTATFSPVTKYIEFGLLSGMTQFKTFIVQGIIY